MRHARLTLFERTVVWHIALLASDGDLIVETKEQVKIGAVIVVCGGPDG